MKLQQPYGRYKMSLFSDFVVRRLVSQIWASIVVTVLLWHCLNFISCIVQYVIRDRDMDLIRSLIIMQSVSPFQFPTDKKKKNLIIRVAKHCSFVWLSEKRQPHLMHATALTKSAEMRTWGLIACNWREKPEEIFSFFVCARQDHHQDGVSISSEVHDSFRYLGSVLTTTN